MFGFLILLHGKHLRTMLKKHYNQGLPHMSLGPGIPSNTKESVTPAPQATERHGWPAGRAVRVRPILGGLHY